MADEACFNRC